MVSGATVTSERLRPVAAERARPGRACDRRPRHRAAPLRRARHGHADQPRAARPARRRHAAPRRPGPPRSPSCAQADRVFSTYRADSVISRLGRGEITLADCPPEVRARSSRSASAAERDSGGAFAVRRGGRPRPLRRRQGLGRANAPPTHLAALPDTDFCLSAGGDITCRTLDPRRAAVAHRHRGPARPDAGSSRSSPCTPAPSPPPAPPTAAPTSSTPAPAARRPASPRSPSSARR